MKCWWGITLWRPSASFPPYFLQTPTWGSRAWISLGRKSPKIEHFCRKGVSFMKDLDFGISSNCSCYLHARRSPLKSMNPFLSVSSSMKSPSSTEDLGKPVGKRRANWLVYESFNDNNIKTWIWIFQTVDPLSRYIGTLTEMKVSHPDILMQSVSDTHLLYKAPVGKSRRKKP